MRYRANQINYFVSHQNLIITLLREWIYYFVSHEILIITLLRELAFYTNLKIRYIKKLMQLNCSKYLYRLNITQIFSIIYQNNFSLLSLHLNVFNIRLTINFKL